MAEVAAAALQQVAAFHQLGAAVALQPLVGRPHPGVGDKRLAIGRLQRLDDAVLQAEQIVADGLALHPVFCRQSDQRVSA